MILRSVMGTSLRLYERLCRENILYEAWRAVKAKNSNGGIDGVSIASFEAKADVLIAELANDLKAGKWTPQPYMGITVPKKDKERRNLGLLSVKDKIVQTAIKMLVEPLCEKLFVNSSYGYRPGRGHARAVRRTLYECSNRKKVWAVRLDIDNFFDNIRHDLLTEHLHTVVHDEEIVRLILLSVQMGCVSKNMKWKDTKSGVPQGGVLSPLLSNLYLHKFDKFVRTLPCSYIRYADDFCLICETEVQTGELLQAVELYLDKKLGLKLNTPVVTEINKGFDFLGINISKKGLGLSEKKYSDLKERIESFNISKDGFTAESIKSWQGICNYYGTLLPQEILMELDGCLHNHILKLIESNYRSIANRNVLKRIVGEIEFLSDNFQQNRKKSIQEYVEVYDLQKGKAGEKAAKEQNRKIIEQRKREYQKREGEGRELIVNTYGCFIGLTQKGVTVKQQGKIIYQKPIGALAHITINGKGITMSSNLIEHCLANKISIDFFNSSGTHTGSILSNKYIESTLWNRQALCGEEKRTILACAIIQAKLKNQYYLVKYFHKYHKHASSRLAVQYDELGAFYTRFKAFLHTGDKSDGQYIVSLVGQESQGAVKYWGYIREMLSDDNVNFEKREHRGAKDLVNCMLNYGYAILYSRVWQALLEAKLNPFDSIIHVRQSGKPTFVYDVVEIFRAQVVDRVVISLIQKGMTLKVENGLLDDNTKKTLSKNILERLNRYENYRGEEITMEQIIRRQAKEIAAYIDKNITYKPYTSKW